MNSLRPSYDVIVIGAGLGGLSVAISLPKTWRIALIAKSNLKECSSDRAQGGIAAVLDPTDSVVAHVKDTLIAGAGLCDKQQVQRILKAAPDAIEWLLQHKVQFTQQAEVDALVGKGTAIPAKQVQGNQIQALHLTREGGHSQRRIVHAADHTGRTVCETLWQELQQHPNIEVFTHYTVTQLIVLDQHCRGAVFHHTEQLGKGVDAPIECHSDYVVLATGGLGQLFALTTNPLTATGDGVALAAREGCKVKDLAFVQFHPTGLAKPENPCFLISEAVRGEGGILRNQAGKRFMPDYDERAELAPRDIVARAIASEMRQQNLKPVWLDITHLKRKFILQHFPAIAEHCLEQGIDICKDMIPVAPAAHYSCGGVVTDANARTDIPGLYAVGEVACTGLHGANRLASNSLLECVVMGRAAAADMQQPTLAEPWEYTATGIATNTIDHEISYIETLADKLPDKLDRLFSFNKLRQIMTERFGIVRDYQNMKYLYRQLLLWCKNLEPIHEQYRLCLYTAILMVQSGFQQKENHGTHFNKDLVE